MGRHRNLTVWSIRRRQSLFGLDSHAITLVARLPVCLSLCLYTCLIVYHMSTRSLTSACMPSNDQTQYRIQTQTERKERNLGDPPSTRRNVVTWEAENNIRSGNQRSNLQQHQQTKGNTPHNAGPTYKFQRKGRIVVRIPLYGDYDAVQRK